MPPAAQSALRPASGIAWVGVLDACVHLGRARWQKDICSAPDAASLFTPECEGKVRAARRAAQAGEADPLPQYLELFESLAMSLARRLRASGFDWDQPAQWHAFTGALRRCGVSVTKPSLLPTPFGSQYREPAFSRAKVRAAASAIAHLSGCPRTVACEDIAGMAASAWLAPGAGRATRSFIEAVAVQGAGPAAALGYLRCIADWCETLAFPAPSSLAWFLCSLRLRPDAATRDIVESSTFWDDLATSRGAILSTLAAPVLAWDPSQVREFKAACTQAGMEVAAFTAAHGSASPAPACLRRLAGDLRRAIDQSLRMQRIRTRLAAAPERHPAARTRHRA